MNLQNLLSIVEALFIIFASFGALYSFFRSKKDETVKIQQSTIIALQQQLDAINLKLNTLEKENTRLHQIIETIQDALKQKGIHITIDGEMVTIEQKERRTSVIRRQRQAGQSTTENEE